MEMQSPRLLLCRIPRMTTPQVWQRLQLRRQLWLGLQWPPLSSPGGANEIRRAFGFPGE